MKQKSCHAIFLFLERWKKSLKVEITVLSQNTFLDFIFVRREWEMWICYAIFQFGSQSITSAIPSAFYHSSVQLVPEMEAEE